MREKTVSIVMPIYNEEELIPELTRRVTHVMDTIEAQFGMGAEWIITNDGSRDRTFELLSSYAMAEPRLTVLNLSRNFGHQPAIQAGIEYAHGDAVVVMDGDLQDPPELIPQLIASWRDGNQVVIAKRRSRAEGGLKGMLFKAFHKLIQRMSDSPIESDSGVFGLLDRCAVNDIAALRERNRFFPGLRSWVGYRQSAVLYDREERAAGAPKQTFGRLFRYAMDAVFSFSHKPLRAIWTMGFVVSFLSFAYGLFLIALRVFDINVVPGFTTPTVAILFLGGVQLISIGILGEYLGRIYDEVKQRPHYIVHQVIHQGTSQSPNVELPLESSAATTTYHRAR